MILDDIVDMCDTTMLSLDGSGLRREPFGLRGCLRREEAFLRVVYPDIDIRYQYIQT